MNRLLKLIFFLILVVFPFGQLPRLELTKFLPGLTLHLFDFIIFSFVLISFLKKIRSKKSFFWPIFFKELVVFGLIAAFSLFFNAVRLGFLPFLSALFYLFRLYNFIFFYWSLSEFLKQEKLPMVKYLFWEGIVVAIFSLFQYLVWPDTRLLLNFGWDEHFFRAIGPFLDPAFTGIILVLAMIVWVVETEKIKKASEIGKIGIIGIIRMMGGILIFLGITLSFSRIAYVCFLASLVAIFFLKFREKLNWLIILASVFIATVLLLPKPGGEGVNLLRKSSFVARTDNYRQTLMIIKDHFWFGVGFNAYRFAQKEYGFLSTEDWQWTHAGGGADNSFFFVFATCGIFGLLAFLYFWLKMIILSFKAACQKKELLLFSSLATLCISGFFVNSLFYPWALFWLTVLLSVFTVDNTVSISI